MVGWSDGWLGMLVSRGAPSHADGLHPSSDGLQPSQLAAGGWVVGYDPLPPGGVWPLNRSSRVTPEEPWTDRGHEETRPDFLRSMNPRTARWPWLRVRFINKFPLNSQAMLSSCLAVPDQ